MTFFVIDQNYFRTKELENKLKLSNDAQYFVVTDTALIEMMKKEWQITSNNSLKIISGFREKICVSFAPSEILKYELVNKKPCTDVVWPEITANFRKLLAEVYNDNYGSIHTEIEKNIASALLNVSNNQLSHSRNKNLLMNTHKAIYESFSSTCLKGLRKGLIEKELEYKYIIKATLESLNNCLSDNRFTGEEIKEFIKKDSFLFRHKALFAWLCLDWIKKGGLESFPEKEATNELMDLDYITIATYGNGILSKEKWIEDAYSEILNIIKLYTTGKYKI